MLYVRVSKKARSESYRSCVVSHSSLYDDITHMRSPEVRYETQSSGSVCLDTDSSGGHNTFQYI